ncbi:hypothetical protein EJ110_NYTH19453 [Nymphaea thermarum]|nr:hypothetical protein EJ110_NYTH19453 [Nymphaea thermarum]
MLHERTQTLGKYSQELNSLRYFPSQKKSCYVIPRVATGKKHKVRASFFYGNYDGKSSPPSFDLQFDGNTWVTVNTSSTYSYYREVIYGPKGDEISVCVARTSLDQIPFISALEIREFEPSMYETNDKEDVLLKRSRTAFGAADFVREISAPRDITQPKGLGSYLLCGIGLWEAMLLHHKKKMGLKTLGMRGIKEPDGDASSQILHDFDGKSMILSIDCRGTGEHTDAFDIKWVGDDSYIKTGKAAHVQNLELNSLRYFPSQKKSCYVIPRVAMGKKHMVRASFFYGNY